MALRRLSRQPARTNCLRFEHLESRELLAVFVVSAGATTGGDGSVERPFSSITAAVNAARLSPGADEIQVGSGTYFESVRVLDSSDLTIRGNASQPPIVRGALPFNFVLPNANFALHNVKAVSTQSIGVFIDNANRPNIRAGSLELKNVQIETPGALGMFIVGLNEFRADNVRSTGGGIRLSDLNRANLAAIAVTTSSQTGLHAEWVTDLDVAGLTVTSAAGNGLTLLNTTRTYSGTGIPPVNAPASADLTGVRVSGSRDNALSAQTNIAIALTDCVFENSGFAGVTLSNTISVSLTNVVSTGNGNGVFVSRGGSLTATNLTASRNRAHGLASLTNDAISIAGGEFSSNAISGLHIEFTRGTLNLSGIVANQNAAHGAFAYQSDGDISLLDVDANDNGRAGMFINRPTATAGIVVPNIYVADSQMLRNGEQGLYINGLKQVRVDGLQATDNKLPGLNATTVGGPVHLARADVSRNSSLASVTRVGAVVRGVTTEVSVRDVRADNNPVDGVLIDNAIGKVDVVNLSASRNGYSGLAVSNGGQPQRASLNVSDSNLSGNMRHGLYAWQQSSVTILRSHLDSNGPAPTDDVPYGQGAWILSTGLGGVRVEDTTAIGTRVGTQTGGGIIVAGASGGEAVLRRVTVAGTQVHPLTNTMSAAGIAVTGSPTAARVEDSLLHDNDLEDDLGARSVIFATVPLHVVRTQLLDNQGIGVDGTQALMLSDSTVARGTGPAVSMGSGLILRSTISGNIRSAVRALGPVTVEQSTITGNATENLVTRATPVIDNSASASFYNSIVAGNSDQAPLFSRPTLATSSGYNLLSGVPAGWAGQSTDIIGTVENRIDPRLEPLADHGGPTLTHMPRLGSPALEAGDPALDGSLDQRGTVRPISALGMPMARPDIGSVEGNQVNTAPRVQIEVTSISGTEGSTLTVLGAVTDDEQNLASLVATLGNLQLNADGTFVWTLETIDDLSATVGITATDDYGLTGEGSFSITVNDVAPQLSSSTISVDPRTRIARLQTRVLDPGTADTHTVQIDWGDGSVTRHAPAADGSVSVMHPYSNLGFVSVALAAVDHDGVSSAVEVLESAVAGLEIRGRQLVMFGTHSPDQVNFQLVRKRILSATATFGGVDMALEFDQRSVDSVLAYLGNGDDTWSGKNLPVAQFVYGDAGNDQLTGGDLDDVLVGGRDADHLIAGAGRDLLFGGLGGDQLSGESGSDVLVAGQYGRETELDALLTLRDTWLSRSNYDTRVNKLNSGVTSAQSGTVRLSIDLVTDDAADSLFGQGDDDWLLSDDPSDALDLSRKERRS